MIALPIRQGSAAWHWARIGIPTASQFDRILTAKTRKLAAGSERYMHELLTEWLLGMPHSGGSSGFMARGTGLEDEAVRYYELQRGVTVERVGFCMTDDRLVGASPDGLVGDEGGLEIKTPSAVVHVANLLGMTDEHYAQAQGGMYVTGRKWWDLLSYNPDLPSLIVRYQRDEEYIAALDAAMTQFLANITAARTKLLEQGCEPATSLDPDFEASLAQGTD